MIIVFCRACLITSGVLHSSIRIMNCATPTPLCWLYPLKVKRRTSEEWLPSGREDAYQWVQSWSIQNWTILCMKIWVRFNSRSAHSTLHSMAWKNNIPGFIYKDNMLIGSPHCWFGLFIGIVEQNTSQLQCYSLNGTHWMAYYNTEVFKC